MNVRSLDRSRLLYLTHALLLGVPILLIGGPISLYWLLDAMTGSMILLGLFLVWFGARLLCLIGWLVLSYAFLTGGRSRLVQRSWTWWLCLMIGIPGAVFFLWPVLMEIQMLFNGHQLHSGVGFTWFVSFCVGLAVLPLALHLFWLRFVGCWRSDQCHAADGVNPNNAG
ncbi:hypothetical protein FUT69_01370 [Xylella taiwanensis]|uniref:Transmembrane protein n=1 Tax=Xylella taiwanensis TaxID=1444770 RepID=Z9JLY0_9GAMM|nr:hypothetical protein [Xylella taiwanensis]AXI84219.1 hypothetical protein AB672_09860 [Xylella taiwanensis]EWS78836.1 hypothetical protein AF72_02960 [Xylella taiwanensis]MCD8457335.1 hypothetical protein [Xylella taiwanensis]MCD8459747.1 hypothetical protein [Xylella taiwanensis]MCD8461384.1 hypothetical protein [Xylella taiwanensis]